MNSSPAPSSLPPRSWEARPWAARGIRVTVLLVPILLGCVAAILTSAVLPVPHGAILVVLRTVLVVAVSTAVVIGVDKVARRILPLAALLSLSLVFPDHAPSRFKSALKSGSSRRLERLVDDARSNGLASDPGDAARQVVQLIGAIGDHDRRTRGHSERVRLYADLVGEELKLSKEDRQKLQWGALLHDLGKLMVPSEILNKAGKPDPEEWAILQRHPAAGMEMIQPMAEFLGEWVHGIGGHHEKWDGTGYPLGLTGQQIPRAGAIVAVADSFEVMTAVRSYKKAMTLTEARAELTRSAGNHFSPEVVRAFLSISLGELRVAAGPLAALAHLPLLGNLVRVPAVVSAAGSAMGSAAAVPVAAAAMMATAMVATPAPPITTQAVAPTTSMVVAAHGSTGTGGSGSNGSGGAGRAAAIGGDSSDTPGSPGSSGSSVGADAAGLPDSPGGQTPTTTAAGGGEATTTVNPAGQTDLTTTTTKSAAPVTSKPTTTIASGPTATTTLATNAPATPTTTAPDVPVSLQVSGLPLRLPAQTLDGSTFAAGATIYVFATTTANSITFSYPGGAHEDTAAPFDMIGGSTLATGYTVPATPGTYTITATSNGHGKSTTVTATIHVA